MAEIGNDKPTLVDVATRTDPDGSIPQIMEVLAKMNAPVGDGMAVECNNGASNKTTIRTGLPTPTYRRYNMGVPSTKTTTAAVEDTTGMLADYGIVDKELADMNSNAAAYRLSENMGKLEGFANKVASDLFYGSTDVTPEGFMGLAPRFNDSSVASGDQLVDGGGTGSDNTSIWFVTWSPRSCHWIYPKGSTAGFQHKDLGEDTHSFADGTMMQVYRDYYKWDVGLTVRDWRGIARIPNIDVSELTKDASAGADLLDLMVEAQYRLNNSLCSDGQTFIYANRTICSFLHRQAMNRSNVQLTFDDAVGSSSMAKKKKDLYFGDMPIHQADALVNTEAAVTFA